LILIYFQNFQELPLVGIKNDIYATYIRANISNKFSQRSKYSGRKNAAFEAIKLAFPDKPEYLIRWSDGTVSS
jgi:hypothetical protein